VGMLHTPKAVSPAKWPISFSRNAQLKMQTSVRHRGSVSSRVTGLQRAETQGSNPMSRLRSNSVLSTADGDEEEEDLVNHPVEPRGRVPILPPVLTKKADKDPLCWLTFTEDAIMTSCKSGEYLRSLR
jgi:catabolite repression protein CreC